ncbi:hypothetical protein [Rubellimicrobium aerolatum]|uniref:Uncharacterized protein n=1 Tax=Rubellimicrobium aerolatum TaxID=490979 RepID=A0ABW0SGH0_9RHOB|nr:hypothetical protein [Rubellimicrobium aerolatum]MBP1807364.1 hypothetical protein [Rubellimicrobium aerolatum]
MLGLGLGLAQLPPRRLPAPDLLWLIAPATVLGPATRIRGA